MSFWSKMFGERKAEAAMPLDFIPLLNGYARESRAGPIVNVQTALEVSTVLACCRVIAEGIAQVPFKLYRETDRGRSVAKSHPLHALLGSRANAWGQTSFEFRETLMFHTILCGNAYVFVNRVGPNREVHELILIEPGRVSVKQNADRSLEYRISSDTGSAKTFGQDAIWHIRGPSWNSWMGLEATRLARNSIGLAVSLEDGQSDFQKNGAKTSGLYSVKEKLSPEKYALLRDWFEKDVAQSSSYRPLILDQDASYTPYTMTGVDQQLLETRKHQIEEICREFRVMPIMVGHADKTATYASAEQMFLAHVVHTLSPWYVRLEQSADVNLLSEEEIKAGYYTKFIPNALMRGAANDRANFYAKALGAGGTKGWLTQNDVRALEEQDRSDDPEADKLPQPTNKPADPTPPPKPAAEDDPNG